MKVSQDSRVDKIFALGDSPEYAFSVATSGNIQKIDLTNDSLVANWKSSCEEKAVDKYYGSKLDTISERTLVSSTGNVLTWIDINENKAI